MKLSRLMVQGALSGLIGGLLYLVGDIFNQLLRLGYVPYGGALQVMAIPVTIVAGVFCGGVIGFVIWLLTAKFGFELPLAVRATIGILFIVFILTMSYLFWGDPYVGYNTPPLINQFLGTTLGVMLFGALPGIIARPHKPFRSAEETSEFNLGNARKLEVASGLMTFAVAGCLATVVYNLNWDLLQKGIRDFRARDEFLLVAILFLLPALLVGFGSCVHGGLKRFWGQVVLAVGCALVLIGSIIYLVYLPFDKIYLWSWLNISFVILAIMSLVFSLETAAYLKPRTNADLQLSGPPTV
ncbi:MAG TPA: hypothetical protein VIT88_10855 [Pyrinomonadaceae bacterium]